MSAPAHTQEGPRVELTLADPEVRKALKGATDAHSAADRAVAGLLAVLDVLVIVLVAWEYHRLRKETAQPPAEPAGVR